MITILCKKDFVSYAKESLPEADFARIEEYMKMSEDEHFYLKEGEEQNPENQLPTENDFFDYLYCVLRLCTCDVDKFMQCLNVMYPLEVVFDTQGKIALSKERFERLVSMRFKTSSAEILKRKCEEILSIYPKKDLDTVYGELYLLLFVCGFDNNTFLRNLADRYQLHDTIDAWQKRLDDDILSNDKYVADKLREITASIEGEINNRISEYYMCIDDYDESPSHHKSWSSHISETVRSDDFIEDFAWLIYRTFPDDNLDEYQARRNEELQLLQDYMNIIKSNSNNEVVSCKVNFYFKRETVSCTMKTPRLAKAFLNYFEKYFPLVENITESERDYKNRMEEINKNLNVRLIRRTALLFCKYGLYTEGDQEYYDMWYHNDQDNRVFVKFGAEYGSLLFDLLKSIPKVKQVLFLKGNQLNRNSVTASSEMGRDVSKKAKWDILKHRLKDEQGWQFSEIRVKDIYPFNRF